MFVSVYTIMCTYCLHRPEQGQVLWDWESEVAVSQSPMLVLGCEPGSSARVTSGLNC